MSAGEVIVSIDARYEGDATRVTEWGTERAAFVGEAGDRLFGVVHLPAIDPVGAVLVCSSLFTDTIFNYRREVEFCRILASRGFAVARFHYRGTGHSEGDPLKASYATMVEDALRMARYLGEVGGTPAPGLLGTRWGALVAAGLTDAFEGVPLAVWEPVLSGAGFFKEALQASGVAHMASQLGGPSPKQSLASVGVANILGFPMGRDLYESGADLSLVTQIGAGPRELLYLAPERNGTFANHHLQAVEELRKEEVEVTLEGVAGPSAWWFVDETKPTPLDAAATTARWLLDTLGGPR